MWNLLYWGDTAVVSKEGFEGEVLSWGDHKSLAVSQKYVVVVFEGGVSIEESERVLLDSKGVLVSWVLPEGDWSRCSQNSRGKMRIKSIEIIKYLKGNSQEKPFCRLLPRNEFRYQLSSHNALYGRVNLLDNMFSTGVSSSRKLLYQYAGSSCGS